MKKRKILSTIETAENSDGELVDVAIPEDLVNEVEIEQGYATPAEEMFKVKSRGRFIDGNLASEFRKYGYPVNWPDGQVRLISAYLYKKCLDSGGRFDLE